jgi:glycine cleavage system aminomethyltransferase T
MCNERGGVIDDLYAYQLSQAMFIFSSSTRRALRKMSRGCKRRREKFPGELKLTDASHNYAAVAVQGPRVPEFINDVIPGASISAMRVNAVTDLKKNQIGGFQI